MDDLQKMINALLSVGFTETEIAQRAGTSQSTVNRLSKGAGTSYEVGKAIEAIYAETVDRVA